MNLNTINYYELRNVSSPLLFSLFGGDAKRS